MFSSNCNEYINAVVKINLQFLRNIVKTLTPFCLYKVLNENIQRITTTYIQYISST